MYVLIYCESYRFYLNNSFWYDCLLKKRGKNKPTKTPNIKNTKIAIEITFNSLL